MGLDSSTQGLKATAVDDSLNVVHTYAINYQRDLGKTYGLTNGTIAKPGNVVVQPTLMVRGSARPGCYRDTARARSVRPRRRLRTRTDLYRTHARTRRLNHASAVSLFPTLQPRIDSQPPLPQYIDALELLLGQMKAAGFPFEQVAAVSGSGQQHGSAYWKTGARAALKGLKPGKPIKEQLAGAFAVPESPIWMDSSTSKQCADLGG